MSITQAYSDASISNVTATSFTVSWTDTSLPTGQYIELTLGAGGPISAVPLPAGAPLLICALAAFGFALRRKG